MLISLGIDKFPDRADWATKPRRAAIKDVRVSFNKKVELKIETDSDGPWELVKGLSLNDDRKTTRRNDAV